jgi:hypothetical protein
MNRTTLTALYLDEVKRSGLPVSHLVGSQAGSKLLNVFYSGRYLARPLFLGQDERDQLEKDLINLRSALVSLPDRLYGGDQAEFARAVGMTEAQISAIQRTRGTTVTSLSRSDMYVDETGFRLLELNMGSALGGMDNADMAASLLEHPMLAEFAEEHRLEYIDTMREEVKTILTETGFEPGESPTMVMTDWPSSYDFLEPYLCEYAVRLSALGLDAHAAHIGQLEVRDGRVWLGELPVDIIYRVFTLEELMESPEAPALMDPILDAVARSEVKLFTPMDAEMFASKGALAILSDERNRAVFDAEELASLDRILPWTRMVRRGPVTLPGGERRELADYAIANQAELILKPVLLHGGQGVLPGWTASPGQWRQQLTAAMDSPYVLQRRIHPLTEPFPADDGLRPWALSLSVFNGAPGFSGLYVRGSTELDGGVMNTVAGAFSTCCFHQRLG